MATRALVLGGGGPVGVGWESGLAAGLEEEGVRLADADFIVGTSAGSIVGSQLALGRPARELLAAQRALSASGLSSRQTPVDMAALTQRFIALYTSERPPQELRAEIGAFALAAETPSEEEWLATFGSMRGLTEESWPERPFVCTAVDTADGSFVVWDKDSGVSLALAVASSCAVPGVFPPITIDGRRYMDGGMRSIINADLAGGYDVVIVVSVTGGGAVQQNPIAERARRRLEQGIDELRAEGSTVEVVVPDEASRVAFGANLLDPSRRGASAEAGLHQGRIEAARLRAVWGDV